MFLVFLKRILSKNGKESSFGEDPLKKPREVIKKCSYDSASTVWRQTALYQICLATHTVGGRGTVDERFPSSFLGCHAMIPDVIWC